MALLHTCIVCRPLVYLVNQTCASYGSHERTTSLTPEETNQIMCLHIYIYNVGLCTYMYIYPILCAVFVWASFLSSCSVQHKRRSARLARVPVSLTCLGFFFFWSISPPARCGSTSGLHAAVFCLCSICSCSPSLIVCMGKGMGQCRVKEGQKRR